MSSNRRRRRVCRSSELRTRTRNRRLRYRNAKEVAQEKELYVSNVHNSRFVRKPLMYESPFWMDTVFAFVPFLIGITILVLKLSEDRVLSNEHMLALYVNAIISFGIFVICGLFWLWLVIMERNTRLTDFIFSLLGLYMSVVLHYTTISTVFLGTFLGIMLSMHSGQSLYNLLKGGDPTSF